MDPQQLREMANKAFESAVTNVNLSAQEKSNELLQSIAASLLLIESQLHDVL